VPTMRDFSECRTDAVHDETTTTAMNKARIRCENDLRIMHGSPDDKIIGILATRIAGTVNGW
jgi:hypothetical protein